MRQQKLRAWGVEEGLFFSEIVGRKGGVDLGPTAALSFPRSSFAALSLWLNLLFHRFSVRRIVSS